MASLSVPSGWLKPIKKSGEWIFRCATDLPALVRSHRAPIYFRQLVELLENDNGILDYHLLLRHNFRRNDRLDVVVYFGNPKRAMNPAPTSVCISCEPSHELSMASLLSEQQHTRAWLDARARPKLIVTPIRHIERLSDLTVEDGEMEAFWLDVVELVEREAGHLEKFYPNMALNHGTYRNHAHLHLKISFLNHIWKSTIAPRHHEKLETIKKLLQDPTIVADCIGGNRFETSKEQHIP